MNKNDVKDYCHVNTNENGDTFVGVKADTGGVNIYFPIGFRLSDNETGIRKDIKMLFNVLEENLEIYDSVIQTRKFDDKRRVVFPINAYLYIIDYYLNYGYYTEVESIYSTDSKGKIDWQRTLKKQKPLVQQNGSFIYTQMTVRKANPIKNKLISKIHMYCVHESFKKMGWLYGSIMPPKSELKFNKDLFSKILIDELLNTYNDEKKVLFQAMLDLINYVDENPNEEQFYFGTDRFEYVWEKIIDKMVGENDKNKYFPKAEWNLRQNGYHNSSALQPDTIMIYNSKIYILDAKYYRYGITAHPNHLPNSSSINKQITYGEYIDKYLNINGEKIFNAFIMPFNSEKNDFNTTHYIKNIGEASGKWRNTSNFGKYEHVQGIVMDVKFLMQNRIGGSSMKKKEIAEIIENVM